MWQLKFQQSYKRIKYGFFALIFLTIILSVGIFLTSFTLVNQMRTLHKLIPSMNYTQRINTQMILLRLEVLQYISGSNKNIEDVLSPLKVIKELVEEREKMTDDEVIKDNMIKVSIMIEDFLKKVKEIPKEEVIYKIKEFVDKVDNNINAPYNISEIENALRNTTNVANTLILISFFIAVFIGGGMFLGVIIYGYISKRQMERIDEIMSMSMIDEVTRIYNRRYFEERLLESVNRVFRFKKPLAVLFIKIEFPKNLPKETYPIILKESAERLVKNTRLYDVSARFSEDVLSSIIQEVDEKEANIVMNRLKNAFERKEIIGKVEENKRKTWFNRIFGFKKYSVKNFSTYIRVIIGGIVYKGEKVGIAELLKYCEEVLKEAEISKGQIKVITLKREEKYGSKTE